MAEVDSLPAKKLIDTINNIFKKQQSQGIYKHEPIQGLEYLVSVLSTYDTSDPRDTINAFRNIAKQTYVFTTHKNPAQSALQRSAESDYTRGLLDVYTSFVQSIYRNTGYIDIICRHWAMPELTTRSQYYPPLSTLPSWIQTMDVADLDNIHGPYNACYHQLANVCFGRDIEPDNSFIDVEGVQIGKIRWSSGPTVDGSVPLSALLQLFDMDHIPEEIDSTPDKVWRTLAAERGSNGEQPPGLYQTACNYVLSKVTVNGHINTKDILGRDPPYMVEAYLKRVHGVIWDRCFIEVEAQAQELGAGKRLHGLAPNNASVGDIVSVRFGCTVPVLLRDYTDSQEQTSYHLIGEMYVYGLMDGEAIFPRSSSDLDADKTFFRINCVSTIRVGLAGIAIVA
ncbi:hypothetical protein LTR95_016715 [Oleoguttula sp. CCFEE 5521]